MEIRRATLVELASCAGMAAIAGVCHYFGLNELPGLLGTGLALAGDAAHAGVGHTVVDLVKGVAEGAGKESARGLENRDLHRLVGKTIARILEREAPNAPGNKYGAAYLIEAAKAFRGDSWMNVELIGPESTVSEPMITTYFAGDVEKIHSTRVLEESEWVTLVQKVGGGPTQIDEHFKALKYVASKLRDGFAFEIWETAKDAWEKNDHAWPALQLRLLGLILAQIGGVAGQVAGLREQIDQLRAAIGKAAAASIAPVAQQEVLVKAIREYEAELDAILKGYFQRVFADLAEVKGQLRAGRAQVPLEGVQQRLLRYLRPFKYEDDLTRHLSRFTGREWVATEINEWLASSRRTLWITGEPGVGKSALAAWLCTTRPEIAAYHFCRFGNSSRTDPGKILLSLAYQLSTQLPGYQDRLNTSALDEIVTANPLAIFDQLFVDLFRDIAQPKKSIVLLIDALDEATHNGTNELADLIGHQSNSLPPWLRVIVTSRPREPEINSHLEILDPWKLDAGRPENLNDIRTYLRRELRPFTKKETPSEPSVKAILEKSEGVFLYVSWVREELHHGRLSLTNVDDFPRGLGGVYSSFFKRYFPDRNDYEQRWRPILECICVAREPLQLDALATLLAWNKYDPITVRERLGSLFPVVDGKVRPFHQSVRDWLTDQRSRPYYVNPVEGEKRLAEFAWDQYRRGTKSMAPYCILHAPAHLAGCGRTNDLKKLLLDFSWVEAKLQAANISDLLADYDVGRDQSSSAFVAGKKAMRNGVEHSIGIPPWKVSFSGDVSVPEMEGDIASDIPDCLRLVQSALRLSAHVLSGDRMQLPSQLYGRLCIPRPEQQRLRETIEKNFRNGWLQPLSDGLAQAGGPLVRILTMHSGPVNSVAITPDGQHAVSGSLDCTLVLWSLQTGMPERILRAHTQPINCVAVTPDGKYAVSASSDCTLNIWDLENESTAPRTLRGHTLPVRGVALCPDNEHIISAASDNTLKMWSLSKRSTSARTLTGHVNSVNAVAIAPDGTVVSASSDRTLRVWSPKDNQFPRILEGHKQEVSSAAITPDGHFAISVSSDCTIRIWDLAKQEDPVVLPDNEGIQAVAVSPDGKAILTIAYEKLKVLDLHSQRVTRTLTGPGRLLGLAISPNCRHVITGSSDHTLQVWDLNNKYGERRDLGHTQQINALAVVPGGSHAISGSSDKTLILWDLHDNVAPRKLGEHKHSVSCVAVTIDGEYAVSGSYDDTVIVWHLKDNSQSCALLGHTRPVNCIVVTPDGKEAISGSSDKTLVVWDIARHRLKRKLEGHQEAISAVAVTPDGRSVISGSRDNNLMIWDLRNERPPRILAGHTQPVTALAVTPDSRYVVSASSDQTLMVWNLRLDVPPLVLWGHAQPVTAIVAMPDSKSVISASSDGTVLLWDLNRKHPLRVLAKHTSSVKGLALTSNAGKVISCSLDQTVKVVDLTTFEQMNFTADAPVSTCSAVPFSNLLLAGDQAGAVHILKIREQASLH